VRSRFIPKPLLKARRLELNEAKAEMSDTVVENLILDLLEWVAKRTRTYEETMDVWRTSCPRLPVWEDANDRGLITLDAENGRNVAYPSRARLPRPASRVIDIPTYAFTQVPFSSPDTSCRS
jgi:hypothetical protein